MSPSTIVIVTERFDPHADAVIKRLRTMGASPMRYDIADLLAHGFELAPCGEIDRGWIRSQSRTLEIEDISAVWWRRPSIPQLTLGLPEAQRRHQRLQIEHAWQSIWLVCDCYWMSYPGNIIRAGWKPDQLLRAARFGFDTPATLITTDADEAADFASDLGGKVVLKTFSDYGAIGTQLDREQSEGRRDTSPRYKATYATVVTAETIIANRDAIAIAPCMFQEAISKKYELRITVIGDKIFPARIDSQSQERTRMDWRHYDVPMLLSAHELEEPLAARCLNYVASYRLNFSAMDFIITPDDRVVFLESNPNGQWLFVEHHVPEYRMTDHLCHCLLNQVPCPGTIDWEEASAPTA